MGNFITWVIALGLAFMLIRNYTKMYSHDKKAENGELGYTKVDQGNKITYIQTEVGNNEAINFTGVDAQNNKNSSAFLDKLYNSNDLYKSGKDSKVLCDIARWINGDISGFAFTGLNTLSFDYKDDGGLVYFRAQNHNNTVIKKKPSELLVGESEGFNIFMETEGMGKKDIVSILGN